jgi:alginate O-acetyltransferase complex protein AlgI
MEFSSLIFIFQFLPLFLLLFYTVKKEARALILALTGLLFYFWGEGGFVLFLLGSILVNYLLGLWIGRFRKKSLASVGFIMGLVLNIGWLAFFKYTHFLFDNLNPLFKGLGLPTVSLSPIHLPIGISFITFQALSYIIDIYRERSPVERRLVKVAAYLGSFPKLVMGPITPYHKLHSQLQRIDIDITGFSEGSRRFMIGLGKKILIADKLAPAANQVFAIPASQQTIGLAWLGIICFTLQIYFDFSGYSDMAIGLGRMCGLTLVENFNFPYVASSIKDFWRRWHISLAHWLRDYLFLPIAYSVSRKIKSQRLMGVKAENWAYYLGSFVTMTLCGLWHGANWTFVLWGTLYGLLLILEHAGWGKVLKRMSWPWRILYTQLMVVIAWVFFRSDNLAYALQYLKAMFGFGSGNGLAYYPSLYLDGEVLFFGLIGILFSTPFPGRIKTVLDRAVSNLTGSLRACIQPAVRMLAAIVLLGVFILSIMEMASGTYNPFIYFRF